MIDLKHFNYFSGEESAVGKAVHQICQMQELAGNMAILFYYDYTTKIGLQYQMQPAHSYRTNIELSNMLADKGLLFRTDIIVIDAWDMDSENLDRIVEQAKDLGPNLIIMAQSYHVVTNNENVAEYTAHSNLVEGKYRTLKSLQIPLKETLIKSKTDGWSATTEDLKAAFIRDKRLDDLLGE
jgi:hypothetical protein